MDRFEQAMDIVLLLAWVGAFALSVWEFLGGDALWATYYLLLSGYLRWSARDE